MQSIKAFIVAIVLSLASSSLAAIAVVNTPTASNNTTGGATLSMNFQCNTGTTGLLVHIGSYGTIGGGSVDTLTSADYASASLTVATFSTGVNTEDTHILYLANPTTGSSQTLNINYSPNNPFGAIIQPICLSGVNVASMIGNVVSSYNAAQSSPISDAISITTGNVAFDVVTMNTLTNPVVVGSQTQISNIDWAGSEGIASSYLLDATAMGWTFGGTLRVAHSVVEVKAAAASGSVPHRTQLMRTISLPEEE